jgi:hypothetical protein
LVFDDGTIIRAGATTRFQYVPGTGRSESGAILFLRQRTSGRTAALRQRDRNDCGRDIQMANTDGTVKVIDLNGKAIVVSTANFSAHWVATWRDGDRYSWVSDIPDEAMVSLQVMLATSGLLSMGPLRARPRFRRTPRTRREFLPKVCRA